MYYAPPPQYLSDCTKNYILSYTLANDANNHRHLYAAALRCTKYGQRYHR